MEEKNSKEEVVAHGFSGGEKSSAIWPGVYIVILLALIIVGGYSCSANQPDNKEEPVSEDKQQSSDETYRSSHADEEEIDPDSKSEEIKKHFNSGVRFSQRGDFDKAIEEYSKALEINSGIAEIHSNLGFAYLDGGKTDLSISSQKKALELDANLNNAYYGLALALERKGDIEGARKNWEQYLESAPKDTRWWNKAKVKLEKIRKISE